MVKLGVRRRTRWEGQVGPRHGRPFHVVDLPEEAARVLLDENARVFAKVTIYSGDRRDPGEADREGKVAEEIKVTYALERVE